MDHDPLRRHLTPQEAAEQRRRAQNRRISGGSTPEVPLPPRRPRAGREPRVEPARPRSVPREPLRAPRNAYDESERRYARSQQGYQERQAPQRWNDDKPTVNTARGRRSDRPSADALRPSRDTHRTSARRGTPLGQRRDSDHSDRALPPRQSRPGQQTRTRQTQRRFRPLRAAGIVAVVSLVVLLAGVVWVDSSLRRTEALTSYGGRVGPTPGTTYLLVGTDSREGLTPAQEQELATGGDVGGKRTDTMMLLINPADGNNPLLVSLPRDLLVSIPEYGENKLNAAYNYGGPPLLVRTLEESTGVRIDHYVEIGFGGFAGVVDGIGGVDVCVPEQMDDPLAGINLPPGCQELDGPQSLGFVRSRAFANADLIRVQNQRAFLSALMKKVASPVTVINPFRLFPTLSALTDAIVVDSGDHVWNLAFMARDLSGDLETTTVPIGGFGSGNVGSYLMWGDNTTSFFDHLSRGRIPPEDLLNSQ